MSVSRFFLLRPKDLNEDQWRRVRQLTTEGLYINDKMSRVIGVEGWSHDDLFTSLGHNIFLGLEHSRLYILDGDQIGSGLNPDWVRSHPLYYNLAKYVHWLQPTPSVTHRVFGCDVSWWNSSRNGQYAPIDFDKMYAQGARFCIHRASIGRTSIDRAFNKNRDALHYSPLFSGIYHLWVGSDESMQMSNLLSVIRDGHPDLPIVIDVEPIALPSGGYYYIDGDAVSRFMDLAEHHLGYRPIIYTGLWAMSYITGSKSWLTDSQLWLARYYDHVPSENEKPNMPPGAPEDNLVMHQFTSSWFDGREWGVTTKGLDVDIVYDLSLLY